MRKVKLIQIGQTSLSEGFQPYAAGIYWKKMSLDLVARAASPIETIFSATWEDSLSVDRVSVTGASFENVALAEVSAIEDLYVQDGTFYYDDTNQNLYLSLFNYNTFVTGDIVSIGETLGFMNQAQLVDINGVNYPLNTLLGSVLYEPRLNDVSISNKLNDQKNGIFVFSDLEVTIKNEDGEYDDIAESISGNKAVLLIANLSDSPEEEEETGFPFKLSADPSDFDIKRSGIVETVDFSNPNSPVVRAIDERSNWTQTIGENLLTVAEFANLPDKYVNDRKAICIGTINGVKAVPLRADSTAASFDYFICDTGIGAIQSVGGVYFKGQLAAGETDRFLTITTEYTINLSTGIVTILNCVKGDVYINGVFTTMDETVEIIEYLLDEFAGLGDLPTNFNQTEFAEIQALAYKTHVYIDGKGKQLFKVIEKLCSDIQVDMFPQGDVLTIRQSNVVRAAVEEIPNYQIIQNPPPWDKSRTNTIKTISVNYLYDYRTKLSETFYDDSLLQTAIDENIKAEDQTFSVNLTDVSDVGSIYELYYQRFINVPREVSFNRTFPFSAGLGDFITFPVIRKNKSIEKTIFSNGIYKITNIDEDSNKVNTVFFANAGDLDYFDGGDSTTDYDYYESGDSTTAYDYYDGGEA